MKMERLLDEAEWLVNTKQQPGILEAIEYIADNIDLYPSEMKVELREFFRQGRLLFGV